MLRLKRPSWMRVNSSSSSTRLVRRAASLEIMAMPRRESPWMAVSNMSVSLQPVMAVRGVRSSCEIDEMNSDCIFSLRLISCDSSLIAVARRPSSSSRCTGSSVP